MILETGIGPVPKDNAAPGGVPACEKHETTLAFADIPCTIAWEVTTPPRPRDERLVCVCCGINEGVSSMKKTVARGAVLVAILGFLSGGLSVVRPADGGNPAGKPAAQPAPEMEGEWSYQSYRPEPGSVGADPKDLTFVPFSPPGVLTVGKGNKGELVLRKDGKEIRLDVTINRDKENLLSFSASAVGQGPLKGFTNELHGWFVPETLNAGGAGGPPLVIRGAINQTSDFAGQPKGTVGYFVLVKAKQAAKPDAK